ncbi:MAG: hypothetical protein CL610_23890 [Anaerolineaceae bacterium]|nr:hypothetical protein [Anaerolineaceae bacterium]
MAEQTAIFEVKEYMVILRQLEKMDFNGQQIRLRGIVRCHGTEHTLDVYFLDEESVFPEPVADIEKKKGYMFMPFRDLPVLVDILRNESPIYAHLRADRPEWTSITTTKEPVGEGEVG